MQPRAYNAKKAKRALSLAQDIVRDIEAGARVAGDRLPREEEMLARYEVARATLREALRFLELLKGGGAGNGFRLAVGGRCCCHR